MKRSRGILFAISLLASAPCTSAARDTAICTQIKALFSSEEYRKYSVPFTQPEPGYMRYEFDLDKNGTPDRIDAYCGNGSDAVCEMTFFLNGEQQFEFSLPVDIRLLEINKKIYIVNGVRINMNHEISVKHYTVHQITAHQMRKPEACMESLPSRK
jgi:hypothetical protein